MNKNKKLTFGDLQVGQWFKLVGRSDIIYMKIKSLLVSVEDPIMWASLGKATRVNAICIKSNIEKFIGGTNRFEDYVEIELVNC